MPNAHLDEIRHDLRVLKRRSACGEIDESTYYRLKVELLRELTAAEREALEMPSTPQPEDSLRPSGLRTTVPSLAELNLVGDSVLLGQWRIVRELGRGGFGAVFEAEEVHLGEIQAVKVLDPAMVARQALLERFRREVSVMRKLDSPHIVRVYDYREAPELHLALISMEYVAEGTVLALRDLARERAQRVPVVLVRTILAQILNALAAAHNLEVIHRDVTPGNVLLAGGSAEELLADPSRDPGVKLVDFGIALLADRKELTVRTRLLGTAAYVAPEALAGGGEVTSAVDVYGAAAVCYELLTDRLPLGRFPEPSAVRSDVPAKLDDLLLALLDLDPARRPAAWVAQECAASVEEPAVGPRVNMEPPPPRRRKINWLGVGRVVIEIAFLVVLLAIWRSCEGMDTGPTMEEIEPTPEETQEEQLPKAGDPWEEDRPIRMRFRYVPAGDFNMGSPASEPERHDDEMQHFVKLTRGFWVGENEVTQGQWRLLMGAKPVELKTCGDDCSVGMVNWFEALAFANKLSEHAGFGVCYELSGCNGKAPGDEFECEEVIFDGLDCQGYRLPTEAEWEYAARAGTETAYWAGENLTTNELNDGGANRWSLYDMHGNVWEWVWDWYGDYPEGPVEDPEGAERGQYRVLRGGRWNDDERYCRAAFRDRGAPGHRDSGLGFRLVRTSD
ncbi:MAG: SUMF1/EgtB/PvdO family nonheme iron enzyme [bacterium]|nr:SUMF1/EgtB/PvdO family nonheme iron enzyme [bacterium]